MTNYTVTDVYGVLTGFVLFVPFALFPGYVIGWASNALQFRSRSIGEKLLIAVPVSISTVPLLIYLTGRFGSMPLTWTLLGLTSAAFVVLFARDLHFGWRSLAGAGLPALAAIGWIVVGLVSIIDFQWKDRLYSAASSYDYALRTEVTDAISRTGVSPSNPFFFPGHPVPLRYHYFWYLPASMVDVLGGDWVGPGHAMCAGTLWCGLGLMALVPLYVWYFRNKEGERSRRRAWVGVLILTITGLDVIPCTIFFVLFGWVYLHSDAWNEIVAGWFNSVIWVPHHVASAIACLTGYLVLWTGVARSRAVRIGSVALAGMAFACAPGLSIYVPLAFAPAVAVLLAISVWKRWWQDAVAIISAGAISLVLATPYLLSLVDGGGRAGHAFITPTVRPFGFARDVLVAFHVDWPAITTVNLFLLPLNYALELGMFFLVAIVQTRRYMRRRAPLGRKEWAEIVLLAVPVLICTFLRSSVIENNDLGWRGLLIPQFILLLWSIDYVRFGVRKCNEPAEADFAKRSGLLRLRRWVLLGFLVGLISTVFGFVLNRAFLPSIDLGFGTAGRWWFTPDRTIGKRTLAMRDTYEWIGRNVPGEARLLQNPIYPDVFYGLYAKRQTIVGDLECGTVFGGSLDTCRQMLGPILSLFSGGTSGNRIDIESLCRQYSISVITVKDQDPVWSKTQSWVWKRKPVFSNVFSRVFTCATSRDSPRPESNRDSRDDVTLAPRSNSNRY